MSAMFLAVLFVLGCIAAIAAFISGKQLDALVARVMGHKPPEVCLFCGKTLMDGVCVHETCSTDRPCEHTQEEAGRTCHGGPESARCPVCGSMTVSMTVDDWCNQCQSYCEGKE